MEPEVVEYKLSCLGGFNFEVNDVAVQNFGSDKARALLVYLAIEAPRSFRRSHLAGLLWTEFSEDQALHSLRQALFNLRKAIPQAGKYLPFLITAQDTISINPQVKLWVDVNAFQTAFNEAVKHFDEDQFPERLNITELFHALELFKGPFLDRFVLDESLLFDEWSLTLREQTNQQAVELLYLVQAYYERRADYANASKASDRIIDLTPWDEAAYVKSMYLYAVREQWSVAKKRYLQLRSYLKNSFAIEPAQEITGLYHDINRLSAGHGELEPKSKPVPLRLPSVISSFVGRKKEMAELAGMLADSKIRLITLIGMGGIGKTRLAIALGHTLHGLYLQGIYFVALAEVNTFDGLIYKIAEALDFTFSRNKPQQQQLIDYLREKRCLLILDSFENLLADNTNVNYLAQLLDYAPGLKLIITSRERLNLKEEYSFLLSGLQSATEKSSQAVVPVRIEAIDLFVERAKQVDNQFTLTADTLPTVNRICQLLEGHPLGIELVASSCVAQAMSDLAADLENNLLGTDSPFLNPNFEARNLSAVMERSWNCLSTTQQDVLSRLAGFSGGFSEQAALDLADAPCEVLAALVNKNLLQSADFKRFKMHEIIRQFAQQKAWTSGILANFAILHSNYYLKLLEGMAYQNPYFYSEDALDQIDVDYENFKKAWNFAVESGQHQQLGPSIEPLYYFFNVRSRFQEGIEIFQFALCKADCSSEENFLSAKLMIRIGTLAHRVRQESLALDMFSKAMAALDGSDNHREIGLAYLGLGYYHLRIKEFKEALGFAQKGLELFEAAGDISSQADALDLMGLILNRTADFKSARKIINKSVALRRKIDDRRGLISSLNMLGDLDCNDGDFISAERNFLESLALSDAYKDRYNQAILLNNLASIYRPQKAYEREAEVLIQSLAICREIGDKDGEAIALNNLGELAVVRGEFNQAITYCQQALEIALDLGEEWTIIVVYDILGEAYLGVQNSKVALDSFRKAIHLAYKIESWDLLTRVMVNASAAYIIQGNFLAARDILTAVLSNSGLLYEYQEKAQNLAAVVGLSQLEAVDDTLLRDVVEQYFGIDENPELPDQS